MRLGKIGCWQCFEIQDLGTEFRQPKTKVLARTVWIWGPGMQRWQFCGTKELSSGSRPAHFNSGIQVMSVIAENHWLKIVFLLSVHCMFYAVMLKILSIVTIIVNTLTLLVGLQAGHPFACKNLRPWILQCFDAIGWVGRRASHLKITRLNTRYYIKGATG